MKNPWNLLEKKALITGGTKGIGLAAAEAFAELGAEVLIVSRTRADIDRCVKDLSIRGHQIIGLVADVSSPDGLAHIRKHIASNWGKLDVLVNNVGMNIRKKIDEYTPEEYHRIFETNLFSALELTRELLPFLRKGTGASVINVASVAALVDVKSGAPYGMSKAAMIQMTRHLAAELAPEGIRVNAVSPWYTRTPLAQPVLDQPERLAHILSRTPLNRIAEPEEVAAAIAFLAMDKASYITGHNIVVDGGMTIAGL